MCRAEKLCNIILRSNLCAVAMKWHSCDNGTVLSPEPLLHYRSNFHFTLMNKFVTEQPKDIPSATMDPYLKDSPPPMSEFDYPRNHHSQSGCCVVNHKGCHQLRRRIFLFSVFLLFIILLAGIYTYYSIEGTSGFLDSISGGVFKRAADDAQSFIDRKCE